MTDPTRGYDGDTISYAGSNRGVDVTLAVVDIRNAGPNGDLGGANRRGESIVGDNFDVESSIPQTASRGHAAGDVVNGTIENLIGSDHDDILTGNTGSNAIAGGKGDDILTGTGGTVDPVFGDVFIFAPGDGVDIINGFRVTAANAGLSIQARFLYTNNRADRIDVRAFDFDVEGVSTLAQLAERNEGFSVAVMDLDDDEQGADGKDDTLVSLPGGGEIHLLDTTGLTFNHFVFDLV